MKKGFYPCRRLPAALAGRTLASAESCTGGLVSQLITAVPGSSAYYLGGVTAYSNSAKEGLLGVRSLTLRRHGAVSAEAAAEMAAGARRAFGSDFAFSVTGIAGPGGAVPGKPVGLVHFAVAGPQGVRLFRRVFPGPRSAVRRAAAAFILDALLKVIE